jgi:hypothetical protein
VPVLESASAGQSGEQAAHRPLEDAHESCESGTDLELA